MVNLVLLVGCFLSEYRDALVNYVGIVASVMLCISDDA
jgi:hypothetical protein